jgi:hypothetical protein
MQLLYTGANTLRNNGPEEVELFYQIIFLLFFSFLASYSTLNCLEIAI